SATWPGSLECEAQHSASSAVEILKRSTTPSVTSGTAWNGFAAERQKVARSGSPARATSCPARSTTATWTVCEDSTTLPRSCSTRIMGGENLTESDRGWLEPRGTAPGSAEP